MYTETIKELCTSLSGRTLPAWDALPDFGLYMDQVLGLVADYTGSEDSDRALTASMVNNYVKMKVIPATDKKKYHREQLAQLIILCVLKPVLPISEIRSLLQQCRDQGNVEAFYSSFRRRFEESNRLVAEDAAAAAENAGTGNGEPDDRTALNDLLLHTALKAQAAEFISEAVIKIMNSEK